MGADFYFSAGYGYRLNPKDFSKTSYEGCSHKENNKETMKFCPSCGSRNREVEYCSLFDTEKFVGFDIMCTTDAKDIVVFAKHKNGEIGNGGREIFQIDITPEKIDEFKTKIKTGLAELGLKCDESNFGFWVLGNCSY